MGSGNGFPRGVNATSIQGEPVSSTAPTNNQVLQFNGTSWVPSVAGGAGVTGTAVTIGAGTTPQAGTYNVTAVNLTASTTPTYTARAPQGAGDLNIISFIQPGAGNVLYTLAGHAGPAQYPSGITPSITLTGAAVDTYIGVPNGNQTDWIFFPSAVEISSAVLVSPNSPITGSYTLQLDDGGTMLYSTDASAFNVTVPHGVFPSGVETVVQVRQNAAGVGSVISDGTSVVLAANGVTTGGEYSLISIAINGNTAYVDGAT